MCRVICLFTERLGSLIFSLIFSRLKKPKLMNKLSIACVLLTFLCASIGICQSNFTAKGDELFKSRDFAGALTQYFLALRQDPTSANVNFKIGITYLQTETSELGVSFLEKAYKTDPQIDSKILHYLGVAYQSSHQYAKAKQMYEGYKKITSKKNHPEIDARISECIVSHGLINNPIDIFIENSGSSVNSTFDDYAPIISADGQSLIFTSNRNTDTLKSRVQSGYEDIYISRKNDDDEWKAPEKIGNGINMGHHDAAASISPDGKTLFIYYDLANGDIYSAKSNGRGGWEKPKPLNQNVNSPFRETHASVSADGKKLFFSSSRPGGFGGLDVYMSSIDETGDWGKPVNLGELVNTARNEDSPFIHHDGVTLYFSSDGHPGMGSSDIFKSTFKLDKWQKPENLGYPLNSIAYDGFFTISEDKRVAYFATRRKYGVGGFDILKATYRNVPDLSKPVVIAEAPKTEPKPQEEKPITKPQETTASAGTFIVQGKAFDKKTSQPLAVTISLVNFKTKKRVATVESDKVTGNYEFKILEAGSYVLTAENNGYLFNTINIQVPQPAGSKKVTTDFIMEKADVGSIMVLNNIFFDVGKADLKPNSILELEKLRKLLIANPNLKVQINGHTDNVGDAEANKLLSLKRALAVVNHLALNGIDFGRLSAKGFGSERPVASNDDEKNGRQLNRRTEIEIVDGNKI